MVRQWLENGSKISKWFGSDFGSGSGGSGGLGLSVVRVTVVQETRSRVVQCQERISSLGGSGEVAERFGSGSAEFGSAAGSRALRAESQASVGEAQEKRGSAVAWFGREVWGSGSSQV